MRRGLRAAMAAMALLALGSIAQGAPILYVADNAGTLGTVDVATGAATAIGSMLPGGSMTDIAFDPAGRLYGTTYGDLYRIDRNTASSTHVGSLGLGAPDVVAFTIASDGTAYAAGFLGALYTVDLVTGAATVVGSIGANASGDLAFHGGTLFMTAGGFPFDRLVSVDTGTGAGSAVGGTSLGVANAWGLARGDDGILYAVDYARGVYAVNTTTGQATFLRSYGTVLGPAAGAAFLTEAGAPEPASIVLLGLGVAGLAARRRLRPAAESARPTAAPGGPCLGDAALQRAGRDGCDRKSVST